MKKRILATLLSVTMAASLMACGSESTNESAGDTETATETEAEVSEDTTESETEATEEASAEETESAEDTEAATDEEPITLRMAWWGSQDRHDKTIAAIELYESLHPNITFEYEYYSF